jgi:hypothetical protein
VTENHETAAALLAAIWRGIPADYKSRYRRNIWEQFENNVRGAAYTSNLGKFVSSLCAKMRAQVGKTGGEREKAEKILNGGNDRALLRLLRDETTLLVLMVRVANQERQEAWKARQEERGAQEDIATAIDDEPWFDLSEEGQT